MVVKSTKPMLKRDKQPKIVANQPRKPIVRLVEEIFNPFEFRMKPVSIEFIEELGKQSIKSVHECRTDVTFHTYFYDQGYNEETVERWRKRSPKFDECCKLRERLIATKRESGAIIREKNDRYPLLSERTLDSMPMHSPKWKEFVEWKASLKPKEGESGGVKVIEIHPFVDPAAVGKVTNE